MEKLLIAFLSLFTLNLMVPNNNFKDHSQSKPVDSQYDGPYVYYKGDKVYADYIMIINGEQQIKTDSVSIQQKDNLLLNVMTDNPSKSFQVNV